METNDPSTSQAPTLAENILPFRKKGLSAAVVKSGFDESQSTFDLSGAATYSREEIAECLRKGPAAGSNLPELVAFTAADNETPAPGEPVKDSHQEVSGAQLHEAREIVLTEYILLKPEADAVESPEERAESEAAEKAYQDMMRPMMQADDEP